MFTFNLDLDVEISMLRAVASEIVDEIPSVGFATGTATPDESARASTTRLVLLLLRTHYARDK
jgi:hypothetical protein